MMQRQDAPRTVNGGKKQTGNEGEMVDEEAEFSLAAGPAPRPMKCESEEQDVDGCGKASFGKESTCHQAQDQRTFEQCGAPCEQQR